MASKKGLIRSSIARKLSMALSALFLLFFLLQHLVINFTSVLSEDVFNTWSHFMGTNPIVQVALQPVLMFGILFHFIMGFILEFQNRKARTVKYAMNKGGENSSWVSRNMLWSGLFILAFMGVHFADFWIPELVYKYVDVNPENPTRYYEEIQHFFQNPVKVGLYCLSFVFLALHLRHGFQSSMQSIGARNSKFTPVIQKIGLLYSILVPVGFIFIALFHYLNSSH